MQGLPISLKARIRASVRSLADMVSQTRFGKERQSVSLPYKLTLSQPFMASETLEGKKHNLREAASRINKIVLQPGETFSFWRAVGNPNNSRRFTYGRSLRNGVPVKDFGGGLCQAAGIMHHISLIAGLEIRERHNHSVDLYDDNTRFAPLGSDATVFYGYKDFRLRNNLKHAVRFELQIHKDRLDLVLHSASPIENRELMFEISVCSDGTKNVCVTTLDGKVVSESTYKALNR